MLLAVQVEVKLLPGGLAPAVAPAQHSAQGLAPVIVHAVRFVMSKTRELRSDAAVARLEMLRGE